MSVLVGNPEPYYHDLVKPFSLWKYVVADPLTEFASLMLPGYMATRADRMLGAPVSTMFSRAGVAFIHIPKNAGTSIAYALYGTQIPHVSSAELRTLYPRLSRAWTTVAVLRDPYERFVSAANFASSGGMHYTTKIFAERFFYNGCDINAFAKTLLNTYAESPLANILFRPQAHFVVDKTGDVCVDHLVSMDAFADAIEVLVGRKLEFPRINESSSKRFNIGMLTKESREIIYQCYRKDFELCERVSVV